ncbi:MAG: hypothetical protein ACI97A_002788 [Planctomycetota bacterium]|jgi:hypothetical protein
MNKLIKVATIVVLILGCSGTQRTQAQELVDYAYPVSGWINAYGPNSQSSDWVTRKSLGDFLDIVMDTVDMPSHPLLHPALGPFISKFHHARWWETINTIANEPLPATGVRAIKLYSSSWIIQCQDGDDDFTFGIDIAEGPFGPSIYTPNNTPVQTGQVQAMANALDVYFVSHIHGDHLSARLIYEMLLRGKPVVATQEIKDDIIMFGAPNTHLVIVPDSENSQTIGPLTYTCFQGWQYGAFLDAAQTIPDPDHPFNTSNNAFIFNLNGKDIVHFGDNNDSGIVPFLQTKLNEGWSPDLQMNLGHYHTTLAPMMNPEQRFLSHDLEFHHFGNAFLSLLVNPNGPSTNRRVLIWGEYIDIL